MGSGAYSVTFDYGGGTGGTGNLRRVVPLPPPEESGAVKFTDVYLSVAYDDFGDSNAPANGIPAILRVLKSGNAPVTNVNFTVVVGRTVIASFEPGDLAASIELIPGAYRPTVTAFVEYGTP
jgi:hypothetical protein